MKIRIFVASAISLTLFSSLVACSGSSPSANSTSPTVNLSKPTTLTVFAAASLTESYGKIGKQFKQIYPGVTVRFSFEGSQTLVDQLSQGAPADVLATADTKSMAKATKADLVGSTTVFASNTLTLITPASNPAKVTGLNSSLAKAKLVICAPEVPCGNATKKLAAQLGVTLKPVSKEQKVTDVRGKVESGEADAGIVYRTDAKASANKVDIISISHADQVVNEYPIAVVKSTKSAEVAKKFVEYVLSQKGQSTLAEYGFTPVS